MWYPVIRVPLPSKYPLQIVEQQAGTLTCPCDDTYIRAITDWTFRMCDPMSPRDRYSDHHHAMHIWNCSYAALNLSITTITALDKTSPQVRYHNSLRYHTRSTTHKTAEESAMPEIPPTQLCLPQNDSAG
jgi:hypothetical protein